MSEIVTNTKGTELAADSNVFTNYLKELGLPTNNIIADTKERNVVMTNLQSFLHTLSEDEKCEARYLSKFVGATAVGLFDAALNYVWNEVVLNLRKKAILYGLDLFFDAAVGGPNREYYKSEEDLSGLKDIVLLDTCRKLELISDVVYLKINHILVMRNEVAASHPNVENIGGYELLGWLQTCVKDILQDKPSESAIKIKALVDNLRAKTDIIDEHTKKLFEGELQNLATPHVQNLLISLFGMYVAPNTEVILRKNIALISKSVWDNAPEHIKYKIGIMLDGYRTNLQQDKVERASEFLTTVNGKSFESLSSKFIALDSLVEKLENTHNAWDNFHHEPAVIREILSYIKEIKDVPPEVLPRLIKIVVKCRLGNGVSYNEGVSPAAKPLYDKFLSLLDDGNIKFVIKTLNAPDVRSKLQILRCQNHLSSILNILLKNSISDRLKEVLNYLLADVSQASKAFSKKEFKELYAAFL